MSDSKLVEQLEGLEQLYLKPIETPTPPVFRDFEDHLATGMKADSGKLRMDLLATDALKGTAKVLTFGAQKYADRNWEKGLHYSRVYGALLRHITAWWEGEETDPESGLSHLDHAACCVMFLQAYDKRNMCTFDDRPDISVKIEGTL